jgi:hypothetical protein
MGRERPHRHPSSPQNTRQHDQHFRVHRDLSLVCRLSKNTLSPELRVHVNVCHWHPASVFLALQSSIGTRIPDSDLDIE